MTIEFVGRTIPITRVRTGFHSFDRAFVNREGDIGLPVKTIAEISGPSHAGKSTLCYTLAGIVSRELGGEISLVDLEGFDYEFLEQIVSFTGYSGKVHIIEKDTDEDDLEELAKSLKEECRIGILDSIGAIAPIGEIEGKLYEAHMGRRALLMAKLSRRIVHYQRMLDRPTMVVATNHVHPRLGGYGTVTPGGETKNYLGSIHIRVKVKEKYPDGSYTLQGKVRKNKWGIHNREFLLFCLSGRGFHPGLSAVMDCLNLKIAKKQRGTGVILLNGEKTSRTKTLVDNYEDQERFEPFFSALAESEGTGGEESEVDDNDDNGN